MNVFERTFPLVVCLPLICLSNTGRADTSPTVTNSYHQIIMDGKNLMEHGNEKEAFVKALEAIAQDNRRYEGYTLATFALINQGDPIDAKVFLQKALACAPNDKKVKLDELARVITKEQQLSPATSQNSIEPADPSQVPKPVPADSVQGKDDGRLEYSRLLLVLADADKATVLDQRHMILDDFMNTSYEFLKKHPDSPYIWAARAAVAIELDRIAEGWQAGQELIKGGLQNSNDPRIKKVMIELSDKGWLNLSSEQIISWLNNHLDSCNVTFSFKNFVCHQEIKSFKVENNALDVYLSSEVLVENFQKRSSEHLDFRIPLRDVMSSSIHISLGDVGNVVETNATTAFQSSSRLIPRIQIECPEISMTGNENERGKTNRIEKRAAECCAFQMNNMPSAQSFAAAITVLAKLGSPSK